MLGTLAEAFGRNGFAQEGLEAVDQAIALDQTLRAAELHRIKGELLLIQDPTDAAQAEGWLRTAIDIARRQSARLFELRARTSLARLLQKQGKSEEARAMLAEVYNWFTEGFEFPDLKDAKALLDELGS
jgi:predicted ATPase